MVTLGVALVLGELANQMSWLTGGADGLQGITMGPILGLFEFDIFGTTAYAYSLVVTFLLFVIARRIVVSPYGLSLRAIRDNPLRARAVGIPVNRRLVAVYTLAAAYAGVAGGLLAQTTQFVSLDVLAFHRSADVMLVLVIGGVGYLYGGLIGAVVFKVLQDVLAGLDAAILAVLDRPDPRPPRPGGPRTADRQGEIRSEALLRPLQGETPRRAADHLRSGDLTWRPLSKPEAS